MVKSFFLSLICVLFLSSSLGADQGDIYNPNFKYTGPQSQTVGEDEADGKDPLLATFFSVLPGIAVHGFGNLYAGDYEFGTRLLVGEIIGTGIAIWGYNMIHEPQNWGPYFGDQAPQAGYWIKAAGVGLIIITWIADVATAGEAAESYNKDHQIQFRLETRYDGVQLALDHRF